MRDDHAPASDYRWARQVAARLLIAVIVVIVLLDALIVDLGTVAGEHVLSA